jgi:hypothetical protein
MDICKQQVPPSFAVSPGHLAACWLHGTPAERGESETAHSESQPVRSARTQKGVEEE